MVADRFGILCPKLCPKLCPRLCTLGQLNGGNHGR